MTDDSELGLMNAMLTQSHNDKNPEMLAHVKRGPLAPPTKEEQIQYLLTSKRRDEDRILNSNYYAMEHVISYQRRVQATKTNFLQRGKRTTLGILKDFGTKIIPTPQPLSLKSSLICRHCFCAFARQDWWDRLLMQTMCCITSNIVGLRVISVPCDMFDAPQQELRHRRRPSCSKAQFLSKQLLYNVP